MNTLPKFDWCQTEGDASLKVRWRYVVHHVLRGYVISMRRTFGEKNLQCARRYLGVVLFVLGCLFIERALIAEEQKGKTPEQESKENDAAATTQNESASSSKGSTASGTQN